MRVRLSLEVRPQGVGKMGRGIRGPIVTGFNVVQGDLGPRL